MDSKIEIKQEDLLSDEVALQKEADFFHEVVVMKRNSGDVLLDNDCDMAIKPEIKSETAGIPIKQIKFETVMYSNNLEVGRKTENTEQTLISDFGSQNEDEYVPEDPVMKIKKYNSEHEMDSKIEIKVEPWWLETETSSVCTDTKDGDFPPVRSSRLCMEAVSGASSAQPSLPPAQFSGRDTSFFSGKEYLICEHQKSDITEVLGTEENVLLEQSGKYINGEEVCIRPLYSIETSLIHKGQSSHKCNICSKSFNWLSHLRTHNLIHEGKRTHQCKTCDKSFIRKSHLKTHNLIHEGKKPHQCKTCDKSFTQLSTLKTHSLIHEGKKPHKCKTCDKSFSRESHLNRHNLIHEGNKPYHCKICDKNFTHLSALKRHHLIHEGKKPHQCKTCDKSFTLLSNLKVHNLIHESKKPHQCKACDKSFIRVSHLQTHNLIHEGKKPHQCKSCDKSFTYLSTLKRHYLIHEGKKPHQCETCDKTFIELSALKKHNLIHAGRK